MDLMAGVEIKGDEAMIQALAEFSKRNASHVKGYSTLLSRYRSLLYGFWSSISRNWVCPLSHGDRLRMGSVFDIIG